MLKASKCTINNISSQCISKLSLRTCAGRGVRVDSRTKDVLVHRSTHTAHGRCRSTCALAAATVASAFLPHPAAAKASDEPCRSRAPLELLYRTET